MPETVRLASSISLATLTPSLVIWGAPNFFSMTTFRPFGPRTVLFGKYSGTEVHIDDKKYLVMNQSDILAIL